MKNKLTIIVLTSLSFGLLACEKQLIFDNTNFEEQTVLYAILNSEEPVHLIVDKTFPSIGKVYPDYTNFEPIVLLYENEKLVETLKNIGQNNFASKTLIPNPEFTYKVEVKNNNQSIITPEIKFVEKPIVKGIHDLIEVESPFGNSKAYSLEIEVKISDFTNPFYAMQIVGLNGNEVIPVNVFHPYKSNEIGDPCGQLVNYGIYWYDSSCATDSILRLNLGFEIRGYSQKLSKYVEIPKIKIKVQHISESYKSLISDFLPEGIERIFNNVSNSYSNIENGLGVAGSINQVSYEININK
ncbi:DUF4249 family protein [Lacihabitans lacunae]|uniref:DUF4249 family protein n=1 Tax=Lacihabitans lacunae TaxID=1028214 RepID=A0ABV7YXF9_9BACT